MERGIKGKYALIITIFILKNKEKKYIEYLKFYLEISIFFKYLIN